MFWGSAEQFVYLEKPLSYDLGELYKGMHTLMRYFWYGDQDHIQKSIENGFSFANAYPAILLKIFPLWIAYPTHILLLSLIYAPSCWILKQIIERRAWILSFFAFQFFNWTGIAFIMGYFNKVIPGIALSVLLMVYSYYVFKHKFPKKPDTA